MSMSVSLHVYTSVRNHTIELHQIFVAYMAVTRSSFHGVLNVMKARPTSDFVDDCHDDCHVFR